MSAKSKMELITMTMMGVLLWVLAPHLSPWKYAVAPFLLMWIANLVFGINE